MEIKKGQGQATYGFVLFFDLMSARTAKKFMDGTMIGRNAIKVSQVEHSIVFCIC